MEPPRRLHPFSLLRGFSIRQIFGLLPALFFLTADGELSLAWVGLGIIVITIVFGVIAVLSYQRHTYEFAGGRIIERSGIISRHERALEIARIQQIDTERTLLDRLVGTCELRLETAADSGDSELQLKVVSVEEAARLRALLEDAQQALAGPTAAAVPPPPGSAPMPTSADAIEAMAGGLLVPDEPVEVRAREEQLVSCTLPQVALAAITGPRLVAIPATIAIVIGFVAENAAFDTAADRVGELATSLGALTVGLLIIAGIILSLIVTAVSGVLRDGGFVISQRGSDLLVRRGLTTTRTATVPLRRVQRVTVHRRWLHARFGYASVTVHSAGGGGGGQGGANAALDRALMVPLMPDAAVDALVLRLLAIDALPEVASHPLAARRRAVFGSTLASIGLSLPLLGVAAAVGRWWIAGFALPLLVLGVLSGLRSYRWLASGRTADAVSSRTGLLGHVIDISPLRKTQGTRIASSVFQRRRDLADLQVHVAGPAGGITLHDMGRDEAHAMASQMLVGTA